MKNFGLLAVAFLAANAMAGVSAKSSLLKLPKGTTLTFKAPFVVTSMASRSGTGVQAAFKTVQIDLVGKTEEAQASRDKYPRVVAELKKMKGFGSLENMFCYIDFHALVEDDYTIEKDTVLTLSKPLDYGTPSAKYTKTGKVIRLENYATKSISANFEGKQARRFYCSFNTAFKEWYNENYMEDVTVGLFETLVEASFTLKY